MQASSIATNSWTILSLLEWGSQYLAGKGFDSSRLNCELLLCHVLRCARIDLYLKFDVIVSPDQLASFKSMFKRRLKHEPLQYIIGETEFMGLRFKVDSRVLIPRPETELLVEEALRLATRDGATKIRILEVGTGSGNIVIALASLLVAQSIDVIIDTLEISADALEVARANIESHELVDRIRCMLGDFLTFQFGSLPMKYDMIISNPPYIPQDELSSLQPEIGFEPDIATTDGADGLTLYTGIISRSRELLKPQGNIVVEISHTQGDVVPKLFINAGFTEVHVLKDYGGIRRVVTAKVA